MLMLGPEDLTTDTRAPLLVDGPSLLSDGLGLDLKPFVRIFRDLPSLPNSSVTNPGGVRVGETDDGRPEFSWS